jgi:hypothetical protein
VSVVFMALTQQRSSFISSCMHTPRQSQLDVTRRKTSPIWGANKRLIGHSETQARTRWRHNQSSRIHLACRVHPAITTCSHPASQDRSTRSELQ